MPRTDHFRMGYASKDVYSSIGDQEELERFNERSEQIEDGFMPGPDTPSPFILKNPPIPVTHHN